MKDKEEIALSLLFWMAVTLFWAVDYSYTLMFAEQNQLFLFSWSYLAGRMCTAGGFAFWISEFFTQFSLYPWAGAVITGALLTLLQILVWEAGGQKGKLGWYPLSFLPSIVILIQMGDIYCGTTHLVALCLALLAFIILRKSKAETACEVLAIPALYWLAGPAVWVYVLLEILYRKKPAKLALILWTAAIVALSYFTAMRQYPFKDVFFGVWYYRIPLEVPALQLIAAGLCVLVPFLTGVLPEFKKQKAAFIFFSAVIAAATIPGILANYDKDTHETIALDQLVRLERWDDILERARKYQPKTDVACVDVNLALFMAGRTDEAADFYRSGRSGIIMPRVRDFISNTTSYEVFWRLGMINSSLRYAFDSQEAEINDQKSGRHMSRIAQCHIVNGNYAIAAKYLDILSRSLFYRHWAKEQLALIQNEKNVASDPVYSYLRSVRFEDDFLYYYAEMDKMLARLYLHNQNNEMAAYYYNLWVNSPQ